MLQAVEELGVGSVSMLHVLCVLSSLRDEDKIVEK
jgi:hypothetical protein